MRTIIKYFSVWCMLTLTATGCGGSQEAESVQTINQNATDSTTIAEPSQPTTLDKVFATPQSTALFLQQATFGVKPKQIKALVGTPASKWFVDQMEAKPSLKMSSVAKYTPEEGGFNTLFVESTSIGFWQDAITGEDQLRQRVAFALSEILVVSNAGGDELTDIPAAVARFQDILIEHAFGNYRDLIEAVTYSPAMGTYLTYLGNQKGDELTGRMPDENYAREILQFFTLGLVELNPDGSEKRDNNGQAIELYTNNDITGLARVFTGLVLDEELAEQMAQDEYALPMIGAPELHSTKAKSFLGYTIPAGTQVNQSITLTLDHIFSHPNVGPFVVRQLIQRLVTSNPSPNYIARVVSSFDSGSYLLPDGTKVGANKRGDLAATVAAIIFDKEARTDKTARSGKLREPILRFTQWARAFEVKNITPEYQEPLWDTRSANALNQHPYRASSVFNFFRPGNSAPGTLMSQNQMVAPEFQITNATSLPGYINFMTYYIFGYQQDIDVLDLQADYDAENIPLDASQAVHSFLVDYEYELTLANDPEALLAHLNLILSGGQLTDHTLKRIIQILNTLPMEEEQDSLTRVQWAILLVMTSADYLIQK
ncbi:DUF1800 domain-containing protein [Pseudoalteromonas piscicida]|uniref:DUF1800 domain-containing protein n=2 Tax=Pseudoalteromonas piscicida TaxID=43662 RepID=A0A2A5JQL8_PSEO7|nr:DUF1800 family protein [Pseudoalteromonas piscicida]PCK31690.1 hypothetical protein CEX98_10920 [Pseudoalteromonas piscicida]